MSWGTGGFGSTAFGFGNSSQSVTSDTLTMSLGDEATIADANTTAVTNIATTSLGSVTLSLDAVLAILGVLGTSAVGTATTISNNNLSVTGFAATMSLGDEIIAAAANMYPTGELATGYAGIAWSWSDFDTRHRLGELFQQRRRPLGVTLSRRSY
jgi:hypothetical protein